MPQIQSWINFTCYIYSLLHLQYIPLLCGVLPYLEGYFACHLMHEGKKREGMGNFAWEKGIYGLPHKNYKTHA